MSFVKYKNSNNASSLLIADITASQTTILITDGDQSLFPSSYPFLLTLEHLDASENVILREIVKVVSGNQNSFTVERSAGICVQDDTATNRVQDNTAHAFYSGDKISLYWTAEQVADIQNNLELKGNQDSIANVYDNTATYSVGDIVIYNGDRYTCTTAVSTPEDFDSTKWTKINIQSELDSQDSRITALENAGGGTPMKIDVLVVGGGGGGGGGSYGNGRYMGGGGGGAGEIKINEGLLILKDEISVVVGSGGSGGSGGSNGNQGNNGGNSRFGLIVALGGGGGGAGTSTVSTNAFGKSGGSGGGSGGLNCIYYLCGGNYQLGGKAIGNGNPGGATYSFNGSGGGYGAGGGGAKRPGGTSGLPGLFYCEIARFQELGGNGINTNFGGTERCLGGGGGGGSMSLNNRNFFHSCFNSFPYFNANCANNLIFNGVFYGGGYGAVQGYCCTGCAGLANTGGGGGGGIGCSATYSKGGDGGSGLVIVRYPTDCSYGIAEATGGTITTATINGISYKVHTFTSSGTFKITGTA